MNSFLAYVLLGEVNVMKDDYGSYLYGFWSYVHIKLQVDQLWGGSDVVHCKPNLYVNFKLHILVAIQIGLFC